MIETLNAFANQHGGLIGLAGLVLAVIGILPGVYFYYNPKQPAYFLSYKIFVRNVAFPQIEKFFQKFRSGEKGEPLRYVFVDVWNSGRETISADVIREPISFALQASARDCGARIVSSDIVTETHPGFGAFRLSSLDERVSLEWKHFDPRMGVRVRLGVTREINKADLSIYGAGLRLTAKNAKVLVERGSLGRIIGVYSPTTVGTFAFFVTNFMLLGFVSKFIRVNVLGPILSAVYVLALFVVAGLAVGVGWLYRRGLEFVFNKSSPIKRQSGAPSFSGLEISSAEALGAHVADLDPADLERVLQRAELAQKSRELAAERSRHGDVVR